MKTTTIEIPVELKAQLQQLKTHPRQAYHEVIRAALLREVRPAAAPEKPSGGSDALVRLHRPSILKLARQHGLRNIQVFGSRARGDARPDSDLDLLYDLAPGRTLFDMIGFKQDLEELIGLQVDMASREGLKPRVKESILADARDL